MAKPDTLVPLTDAAKEIGIHRSTLNERVLGEQVPGQRIDGRWYIRQADVDKFKRNYVRPRNTRRADPERLGETDTAILLLLLDWENASPHELARILQLDQGNVRNHLRRMQELGWTAWSDSTQDHVLTESGRQRLRQADPSILADLIDQYHIETPV